MVSKRRQIRDLQEQLEAILATNKAWSRDYTTMENKAQEERIARRQVEQERGALQNDLQLQRNANENLLAINKRLAERARGFEEKVAELRESRADQQDDADLRMQLVQLTPNSTQQAQHNYDFLTGGPDRGVPITSDSIQLVALERIIRWQIEAQPKLRLTVSAALGRVLKTATAAVRTDG